LVRPTHKLQRRFDVPPGLGIFALSFLFEGSRFLGGFGNSLGTVCFQQLPCVILDVDFVHFHGFISPLHE
jgi:hypothetical protein